MSELSGIAIGFIAAGLLIITLLSFYAGKLLFQLKQQNARQAKAREERLARLLDSIETIAFAVQQQQCNLSEGAIRLCNLLDALPDSDNMAFRTQLPHLYDLFVQVSGFDTHEARKALSAAQRKQQDQQREEIESQFEQRVLKELEQLPALLKQYSV